MPQSRFDHLLMPICVIKTVPCGPMSIVVKKDTTLGDCRGALRFMLSPRRELLADISAQESRAESAILAASLVP